MIKWLLVAFLIGIALLLWRSTAFANRNLPKAGAPAPGFNLPDQDGRQRTNADFHGKWLVLYFYPRDDTPGCTEQACAFRDDLARLTALGAGIAGVSVDGTRSHQAFAKKYSLPFPLLADAHGEVARRYGSLLDLGVIRFARRNTFLIDPQGRVAKVYLSANTSRNSQEVIDELKKLIGT
jgi:thioredoxin-dependent peroxiredoxin